MGEHAKPPEPADPYLWLEDVTGEKALAWVRERNAETDAELAGSDGFTELKQKILAVLDSDARIPEVEKLGPYYYNFWQDAEHERGLWRRTTLEEYRKSDPDWETVIDLDALNRAEGENWVWHGAEALRPDYERALVALSRGGADADVTREFDLTTKQWVPDGFVRAEAKGELRWIDRDRVFVATDTGEGSMTSSGYPRTAREWRRGQPLEESDLVFAGEPDDMVVQAVHDHAPGFERDFVVRRRSFYSNEVFQRRTDGTLVKVDAPDSAEKSVHHRWLTLRLRDPWTVGDTTHAAGSLLVGDFDRFMSGDDVQLDVVFEPTETTSLESYTWTQHHLVLDVLDNVNSRVHVLTPDTSGWRSRELSDLPELSSIGVRAVDSDESDDLWLTTTGFLTPTTLSLLSLGADAAGSPAEPLKSMPEFFDGSAHVVEQHHAVSADGTRVPYFVVRPRDLAYDGTAATLLTAYGGFEISLTPAYSGVVGRGWIDRGGVYVVANIRGGGEFGPRWHQAALRENRHRAYQDFVAVARDLVARGITSPERLGIHGGSNGGLLIGNILTQFPDAFGAAVITVPLLDMRRYSHLLAGASWMAEFGDPDTDDWDFLRTFSPYHLFDPARDYPPVLLWTTTRDDRVHPGHARKMVAAMRDAGKDVRYFENIEGGHGAGATNAQAAHMQALTFRFLAEQLSDHS